MALELSSTFTIHKRHSNITNPKTEKKTFQHHSLRANNPTTQTTPKGPTNTISPKHPDRRTQTPFLHLTNRTSNQNTYHKADIGYASGRSDRSRGGIVGTGTATAGYVIACGQGRAETPNSIDLWLSSKFGGVLICLKILMKRKLPGRSPGAAACAPPISLCTYHPPTFITASIFHESYYIWEAPQTSILIF